MRTVGNNASSMASRIKLSSIASVAATATMTAAWAALAAQGVALVSSAGPLVGLLAGLPGLLFAAIPGVGALLLGFSGLAAALHTTAGGAGQSATAIAAAEHRVEIAQRAATQAQQDLNDARATAAQRLRDIRRELAHANLDQRAATLAVRDAELALRAARMSGNRDQRIHAELALAEAQQNVIDVQDHLSDVTAEANKRQADGIEGSDEVKTALQKQADATYELAQAQRALTEGSGGGGIDKAAEAYAKLTTEGRSLVDVLKAIAPAWREVQQAVQAKVLAGVADSVRLLSNAYLPVMLTQLPAIGQGWNNAFNDTAKLAASEGFVKDINDALGNAAVFWQKIGSAFAPFLDGFRHFAVVGATFLPRIGDWVLRIGQRFDAWAEAARRTGRAHGWIEKGLDTLSQWWSILKNLGASIVAIFRAGSGGPDWLPRLVEGTAQLRAWLESPAGQGKLAEVFGTLRDIGAKLFDVLKEVAPTILGLFSDGSAKQAASDFADALGWVAHHLDDIKGWLPVIAAGYVAYKASLVGAVIVEGIRLPILAATAVANWRLASALKVSTIATEAGAAANTAFGVSTFAALGIVGLFIIAIALMAVEIWYMVTHFDSAMTTLRYLWDFNWNINVQLVRGVLDWISNAWNGFIGWISSLPGRIGAATSGMWDGLTSSFRQALNAIIYAWNRLSFTIGGGSIFGMSIPSVTLNTPDIPYLDTGGRVLTDGLAFIHRGEDVIPAAQVDRGGGGGSQVTISFAATGDPLLDAIVRELRKHVRVEGGGNVQIALGR